MSTLTEKQRRFVEAYMGAATGNATAAARLAGYRGSQRTMESVGSENLRKPEVQEAIADRVDHDPVIVDRKARQQFWSSLMNDPVADMRYRLKASELLGRSQGDFIDHRIVDDNRKSKNDERLVAYRAEKHRALMEDPEGCKAIKKAQERLNALGFGARADLALRRQDNKAGSRFRNETAQK